MPLYVMEFNFNSSIRGYHIFHEFWDAKLEDNLICAIEDDNSYDKFCVRLYKRNKQSVTLGHVPMDYSKTFYYFIKRGGKITATVTGNKFFDVGLEIPCTYTFHGAAADIEKLSKLLK